MDGLSTSGCMFGFVCAICPYITIGAVGTITTVVTVVFNGYKIRISPILVIFWSSSRLGVLKID